MMADTIETSVENTFVKNKYDDLIADLRIVQGKGHSFVYHLVNGSDAYRAIFVSILQYLHANDYSPFWVTKKSLMNKSRVHSSIASYIFYKLESEGFFSVTGKEITFRNSHIDKIERVAEQMQRMKK